MRKRTTNDFSENSRPFLSLNYLRSLSNPRFRLRSRFTGVRGRRRGTRRRQQETLESGRVPFRVHDAAAPAGLRRFGKRTDTYLFSYYRVRRSSTDLKK